MEKDHLKKYKLIREYPTSPELNTIVTELPNNIGLYQDKKYYRISKNEIENYPEFWELIVEKDYEILSFKALKNSIWKKRNDGFWAHDGGYCDKLYTEENMLTNSLCTIHSVKRLSDGEVFTVGDKCHLNNGNYYKSELKEFKFVTNGEHGHLEKHRNNTFLKVGIQSTHIDKPTFFYLEDIVKVKQPLFKTEDGVDIFEDDDYYYVNLNEFNREPAYTINNCVEAKISHLEAAKKHNLINFSTKKAAEEWIIYNKPMLSINDIEKHLEAQRKNLHKYSFKEFLCNIVQKKLHKS